MHDEPPPSPEAASSPPPADSDVCNFDDVVRRLRAAKVEFIVIGGQAESLLGSPRITSDTDICYRHEPENLRRIVEAIEPLGPWPRNCPRDVPFIFDERTLEMGRNFTFDTSDGKLDLLAYVEPLGEFDDVARGQEHVDYDGRPLAIIGLEDLIRIKEHLNRRKDYESKQQLYAIRQLRSERSQGS